MRFRGRSSSLCLFINLRRVAQSRVWIRRAGGCATHLIVDIQAAGWTWAVLPSQAYLDEMWPNTDRLPSSCYCLPRRLCDLPVLAAAVAQPCIGGVLMET